MPFPSIQTAGLVTSGNFVPKSTTGYTANNGDIVLVTTGSSAITVNLPPVAQGGPVTIRKVDVGGSGALTVKSTDGSTIDTVAGATGRVVALTLSVSGATLVSDGTNWWTVAD